ncbi:hypothetical protein [Thalassolituus oleivorans]|uniref:hypothetical protein n=1 Tax=Thalassolituus oleivorans TaxID=187493 RepID=UPI0023F1718A|nr:hypothetical protein [Thalassolituus oleivorans]
MSLSIIDLAELNTIRLIHPDRVVVVTHKHSFDSYKSTVSYLFEKSIDMSIYVFEHADLYEVLNDSSVLALPWLSDRNL